MNRKFGIGILVFSFGLSSVNAASAAEMVNASPIIVQPSEDLRDISQQMLAQDEVNRDQELAIKGLIEDNQRLADTALAREQDATLEKIDQTMIEYRNFLINRDREGLDANGRRISKYHDLITLTEDVDDMKESEGRTLKLKSDTIEDKHEVLTELKDELTALNEKLKMEAAGQNYSKVAPEQNDKIRMLTQKLPGMDQRIAHYDEILAEKDREIAQLNNKVQQQDIDLKAKDDSIRWLNQVLSAAKSKAEYYELTSRENKSSLQQVQVEVQRIKDDFSQRFKVYSQFENAIVSLKSQVSRFATELSQKQEQIDLLKSELENKITETSGDERLKLARQLIDLQQRQAALLDERNRLREAKDVLLDQHVRDIEGKMKGLLVNHQIQSSRMEEFKNELEQKNQQVELLKTDLKNKISEEKNQSVLDVQIQDLNAQLRDKEGQISTLKASIQSGQGSQSQSDALKQQLADQQNKVDLLKQELASKSAQSEQMSSMMSDYQKKLESKDNVYNQQLQQVLLAKNDQAQMAAQITDLSTRLQEKEGQIVKLKKAMYDLKETKDLNLSTQQKLTDDRVKVQDLEIKNLRTELALARQQLGGMPSNDEIEFLRTGLKKAIVQIKQKDDKLTQLQANSNEYQREFKAQSLQFQSLKEQLQNATDELNRRNDDLKYKKLELVRFKEQTVIKEGDLLDQVKLLTRRLQAAERKLKGHVPAGHEEETQIVLPAGNDALSKKLKEALDKIDEQGRIISVLAQKLQDAGQSVDLSKLSR